VRTERAADGRLKAGSVEDGCFPLAQMRDIVKRPFGWGKPPKIEGGRARIWCFGIHGRPGGCGGLVTTSGVHLDQGVSIAVLATTHSPASEALVLPIGGRTLRARSACRWSRLKPQLARRKQTQRLLALELGQHRREAKNRDIAALGHAGLRDRDLLLTIRPGEKERKNKNTAASTAGLRANGPSKSECWKRK